MTKTTFEMDGLFTQEDIDNRHFIMGQCLDCKEWTKYRRGERWRCDNCKGYKFDMIGQRSIRTWIVTRHLKTSRAKKKNSNA